jgi:hypothetical protein
MKKSQYDEQLIEKRRGPVTERLFLLQCGKEIGGFLSRPSPFSQLN